MGGGDGGDPWVVVLLGITGAGKSATGNSLLNDPNAFIARQSPVSITTKIEIKEGVIESINVPLKVVDTPGFGDSKGRDIPNIASIAQPLQKEVPLVNAFLVVFNANNRVDQQTYEMLKAYIRVFGQDFLKNMVIVVTNWGMSKRDCSKREREGVTQTSFMEQWLQAIRDYVELPDQFVPFIFIDNEMLQTEDASEEEQTAFSMAKLKLCEYLSESSCFPCVQLGCPPAVRKRVESIAQAKGLVKCKKCERYYHRINDAPSRETAAASALSGAAVLPVASARLARVAEATQRAWTSGAAIKAMARGWNGSTGVHLLGKVASRAGVLVQVGIGVYRLVNAKDAEGRAKAVLGTGAGIAGGAGGMALGVTIGTAICPGLGTVLGGFFGSIIGSIGAQYTVEKGIEEIAKEDICYACSKAIRR